MQTRVVAHNGREILQVRVCSSDLDVWHSVAYLDGVVMLSLSEDAPLRRIVPLDG